MDSQIAQFASIAGVSADRAKFFVEAANGDVQAALATFYESEGGNADAESAEPAYTGPRTLSGAPAEPLPDSWGQGMPSSAAPASASTSRSSGTRGGVATLGSLRGEQGGTSARGGGGAFRGGIGRIHQGDDDDDDDDAPPNLFAGGERSGLSVQDPEADRRRRLMQAMAASGQGGAGGLDMVNNILRQAAEAGPPPAPTGGRTPAPAATGSIQAFGGRGRTIGDADEPEVQPQAGSSSAARSAPPGAFASNEEDEEDYDDDDEEDGSNLPPAVRHLIFWQDGFTIGDSHLYNYDDPENQRILAALQAQRAPLSLLNVKPNQEVELRVEKRTDQKYAPPPPGPLKPFTGTGNRLSSPVPSTSTAASAAASTSAAGAGSNAPPASQVHFEVDSSKPTTQLNLRLADGSRLVARFNHDHTVQDVRNYINAANPGMNARPYVLQASFPPKPVEDESQTLKDAGLINAVVIQKWA